MSQVSIKNTYLKLLKLHATEELYLLDSYLKTISNELRQALNISENVISVSSFEEADKLKWKSLSGEIIISDKDTLPIFSISNFNVSREMLVNYYSKENSNQYYSPYNTETYLNMIGQFDCPNMKKPLSTEEQQNYDKYCLFIDDPCKKPTVLVYSTQNYDQLSDKKSIYHGFNFENYQYIKNPSITEYNLIDVTKICKENNYFWRFIACLKTALENYSIQEQRRILTDSLSQLLSLTIKRYPTEEQFEKEIVIKQIQKSLTKERTN